MNPKGTPGRIKTKVKISAVKIHGPNSPDVKNGRVPVFHREDVQMETGEQTVELTEKEIRELFGDELADEWFSKGG